MKKRILLLIAVFFYMGLWAQKSIYIPQEHQAGINNCSSTYCMDRSYQTANFLFLWQNGVTPNTSAMQSCEPIFSFYVNTMKFASTNPNANIHKYKIVVMLDPGLGGVAYGSGVDGVIGAMWVGPGTLGGFVFAHELGHSMSYQAGVDGTYHYGFQDQPGTGGSRIYCGPFWETTANYMAFQQTNFQGGANGNVGLYMRCYNYFFTHARSRYEGWPMLEALKRELGVEYLGKTWLESKDPEHPIETIKRVFRNNDQAQVNDLFGKCAMRLVNWDIAEPLGTQIRNYVAGNTSEYLPVKFQTLLRPINVEKGRYAVSDNFAPQEYGYNAIKLFPQKDANGNATVYVHFRGMKANDNAGWRYGFVAKKSNGTIAYSSVYSSDKAIVNYAVDATVTDLFFVVVGAPTRHTNYGWEIGFPKVYRYRYELALKNAFPEGYEPNFRKPANVSGHTHTNGGGFVANTANVSSSVYVGPNAKVLGSAQLSGNVRVEDWAVVTDNAVISGNAKVKGHAIVGGTTNAYDYAIIDNEARVSGAARIYGNAQILDNATIVGGTINGSAIVKGNAFEWGQTIGGTAVMGGDNENTSATSGVYLQKPDSNNGRTAGDGKGATDPTNIDVNTIAVSFATDVEMEIPIGGSAPVAAFTASATSVATGVSVTFTDQSSNAPTSWTWNFGDGTTSTVQNPVKSYTTTGTYTVSLTVTNASGTNTLSKTNYITVTSGGGNTPANIALIATASTSYVSSWETLSAVNDNSNPSNSNDKSSGAYGNWNNPNTIEWVQYDWASNYTISKTEVYWFDDAGGVLTPTTAYVEYWNGSSWVNCGIVPKVKDTWNVLNISNITTNRFRISMLNTSQSTGILEWRVWGVPAGTTPTNIALSATASTSYVSSWETLSAVNNNSNPSSSNDKSSGAYGNWNNPNTIEWVQYDWSSNYTISKTEVYWFDDNGGVLTPTTAYVEYWNGSAWINCGTVPKVKNAWNVLNISNVTTNRFRISMLNTSQSTGILEWRVWGIPAAASAAMPTNVAKADAAKGIHVYPNPARSSFRVDLKGFTPDEDVILAIYDLKGKEVWKGQIKKDRSVYINTDILKLARGLYLIKALNTNKSITQKLMILE
jgi:PKD repeat protein